jgi:hypothetical protein
MYTYLILVCQSVVTIYFSKQDREEDHATYEATARRASLTPRKPNSFRDNSKDTTVSSNSQHSSPTTTGKTASGGGGFEEKKEEEEEQQQQHTSSHKYKTHDAEKALHVLKEMGMVLTIEASKIKSRIEKEVSDQSATSEKKRRHSNQIILKPKSGEKYQTSLIGVSSSPIKSSSSKSSAAAALLNGGGGDDDDDVIEQINLPTLSKKNSGKLKGKKEGASLELTTKVDGSAI